MEEENLFEYEGVSYPESALREIYPETFDEYVEQGILKKLGDEEPVEVEDTQEESLYEYEGVSYPESSLRDLYPDDFDDYVEQGILTKVDGLGKQVAVEDSAAARDMDLVSEDGLSESQEEDTWLERTFGKNEFTDFFGDIYRAGKQGFLQAESVDPSIDIMTAGEDASVQDLYNYVQTQKRIQKGSAESDEMKDFNRVFEESGGGAMGFLMGVLESPTVLPSLFVSSMATQIGSLASEEVAASAAAGAGTGAVVGSSIPLIGTATGALGGGFAGLATAMEAGLTFSELLQEEIDGEITIDKVQKILQDPEKLSELRRKAVGRGAAIGAVEALSAGLAGKATKAVAGAVKKGKSVAGRAARKAAAPLAGGAVEVVGGSTGEVAGRLAAGQEMDVKEIGFEGFAGLGSAPLTVLPTAIKNINTVSGRVDATKKAKEGGYENVASVFKPDTKIDETTIELSSKKNTSNIVDEQVEIEVANGRMTEEESDAIKLNFRDTQGAVNTANKIDRLTPENKTEAVELLIEEGRLKEKIKDVDNAALTKTESERLKQVQTRLEEISNPKEEVVSEEKPSTEEETGVPPTPEKPVSVETAPAEIKVPEKFNNATISVSKGESINEVELEDSINEAYDYLSEIENDKSEDAEIMRSLVEDEIEKLENYDNITETQTRKIAEEKTVRTVKKTPRKTSPKREKDFVGKKATYSDNKGAGGRGSIIIQEGPDGRDYYVIEQANDAKVILGRRDKAFSDGVVNFDENNNPASVTFPMSEGKQVTVKDPAIAQEFELEQMKQPEYDEQIFEETYIEFVGEEKVEVPKPKETTKAAPKTKAAPTETTKPTAKERVLSKFGKGRVKNKVRKQVENARKALSKIAKGVTIEVYNTKEEFEAAGGNPISRGEYVLRTKTIRINLEKANTRTVAHEVFHAILLKDGISNAKAQQITSNMIDAVRKVASKKLLKELDDFAKNYKTELQSEESMAQLFGILAENYESSPQSVKDLINDWLRKLAKILNVPVEGILDSDKQVLEFLDVVSGKVARGEVIEQSDIALLENKSPGEVVNSVRQQKGLITLSEQEVLKYARAGIENQYESQAIKQIGLQGVKFNKEGIQGKVKEEFDKLIKDSDNYIMSEDSKAVDGAIQFEIDTLINDGASEAQIEQAKQAFNPGSIRDSFINDYKGTQKETLDQWKSYLSESDYNDSFKYLILDAVLTNNYDFKTNKYSKRTNKTLRNFTPFDAGTLAALYAIDSKSLLKDYVEIQAKNSLNVVESSSFVSTKEGEWVKFEGGPSVSNKVRIENANKLSQIVQNTYWCTKTNAKSQLDGGDFYVYATKNKDGEYESRIAVRMKGDEVGEVRGNASSKQDLEPDMMPVADKFLKENIPNNSGKKWLDSIEYNTKVKDLTERISGKKINEIKLKEYFNLIKDADKFKVDYGENGLVTELKRTFDDSEFDFPVARNLRELRPNTFLYIGNFKPTSEITSDFFPKYIYGDAYFSNSQVTDLGNLKSIGGSAYFNSSQVTDLGNLESISGYTEFKESQVSDLGNLKNIGGTAVFTNSQVTNLGSLERIGGRAYFNSSQVTDLGNLESIGRSADFQKSQVSDLGNLKNIGGNIVFTNSQVTNLGSLERIGGTADFTDSKVSDLGNLKSIGGMASFGFSQVTNLGNLESIGGPANFSNSQVSDLGSLERIGGTADFTNSKVTDLGNLESIGRSADFQKSQVSDLGSLERIGGYANFSNSQVTDLGKLKSISGSVDFGQNTSLKNEWENRQSAQQTRQQKVEKAGITVEKIIDKVEKINKENPYINCEGFCNKIIGNKSFKEEFNKQPDIFRQGENLYKQNDKIDEVESILKPGDIIAFGDRSTPRHFAIYLTDGEMYEVEEWGAKPTKTTLKKVINEYESISDVYRDVETTDAPSIRQQQAQDDFTIQDVIKDAEQEGLTRKETIEVLQELGFTKDEIRKAIKPSPSVSKVLGKPKEKKVSMSEKQALNKQIRDFARGVREAYKDQSNFKKKVNKLISDNFKLFGNLTPSKVIALTRRALEVSSSKPESLDKFIDYAAKLEQMTEDNVRKDILKRVIRNIAPKKLKKTVGGVLKGKIANYEGKVLSSIRNAIKEDNVESLKNSIDELENKQAQGIKLSEKEIFLLQVAKISNNLLSGDLKKTLEAEAKIEALIKDGKSKYREDIQKRATEYERLVIESLPAITGGKKLTDQFGKLEQGAKRRPLTEGIREKLSGFLDYGEGLRTLLDKIDRTAQRDESGYGGVIDKELYEPVADGRREKDSLDTSKINELSDKLTKIYGKKKKKALRDNQRPKKLGTFTDRKGNEVKLFLSQNQAYPLYQYMQDPSNMATFEAMGFTDEMLQAVEDFLTPEVKEWADWQMSEFFPKYYDQINAVYKDMNDIDLPKQKIYVPIIRNLEGFNEKEVGVDEITFGNPQSTYKSLKQRQSSKAPFDMTKDGNEKLMEYVEGMNRYIAFAKPVKRLNVVFKNKDVRNAIREFNSPETLKAIDGFIEGIANNSSNMGQRIALLDKIRGNVTIASLALAPTVTIKQLTSIPAYASDIPISKFISGLGAFARNPKKVHDILMESEYMQRRYKDGFERDLEGMKGDYDNMLKGTSNLKNKMMFLIKWGDKGAILMGGYSVYKYHFDKSRAEGKSIGESKKIALSKFEEATKLSQQSINIEDLSQFQRMGSLGKLFTMYMTSPMSYFRQERKSARDFVKGYKFGDKKLMRNAVKRFTIYHFVLPLVFQYVASGLPGLLTDWDEEDEKDLMRAASIGSLNGVFIAGQLISYFGDILTDKAWVRGGKFSPSPAFDAIVNIMNQSEDVIAEWNKNPDKFSDDLMKEMIDLGFSVDVAVGLPVNRVKKLIENWKTISDDNDLETREKIALGLGFSPYVVTPKQKAKTTEGRFKKSTREPKKSTREPK